MRIKRKHESCGPPYDVEDVEVETGTRTAAAAHHPQRRPDCFENRDPDPNLQIFSLTNRGPWVNAGMAFRRSKIVLRLTQASPMAGAWGFDALKPSRPNTSFFPGQGHL